MLLAHGEQHEGDGALDQSGNDDRAGLAGKRVKRPSPQGERDEYERGGCHPNEHNHRGVEIAQRELGKRICVSPGCPQDEQQDPAPASHLMSAGACAWAERAASIRSSSWRMHGSFPQGSSIVRRAVMARWLRADPVASATW